MIVFVVAILIFSYVIAQEISDESMELNKGWNLISVTPPMAEKSLIDIWEIMSGDISNCNVTRSWLYIDNEWMFVKPAVGDLIDSPLIKVNVFDQDHVGFGMWVFIGGLTDPNSSSCTFACGIGGCMSSSDAVTDESVAIKKDDYFVLGDGTKFQYKGTGEITSGTSIAKFINLKTGVTLEVIASSGIGSIKHTDGNSYVFTSASNPNFNNYDIKVDLNGDGNIG